MSWEPLREFRDTAAAGDAEGAFDLIDEVAILLEDRNDVIKPESIAARLLQDQRDARPSERDLGRRLVRTINEADQRRNALVMELMALEAGQFDREQLVTKAEAALEAMSEVDSLRQQVRQVDGISTLPPTTVVSGQGVLQFPEGYLEDGTGSEEDGNGNGRGNGNSRNDRGRDETPPSERVELPDFERSVEVTIGNAGGSTLENVDVSVQTELNVDLSVSAIDGIERFEKRPVTLTVESAPGAGQYPITLFAAPDNASNGSTQVSVRVISKAEYLAQSRTDLEEYRREISELESELNRSVRPFYNRISRIDRDIEDVISATEEPGASGERIDRRIDTVLSTLNSLYGLTNSLQSLSAVQRTSLRSILDSVSRNLQLAQVARM